MPESSMECRCAGCSSRRFEASRLRSTSVRIMILCSDSTNGRPIFEYSKWRKSKPYPTCHSPSFRGTIDRNYSARILGPDAILDAPGLGVQTARLSGLLQPPSDAFSTYRMYAAGDIRPKGPCESPRLPMASTLWRFISNAHGRLMLGRQTLKTRTN